MEHPSPGVLPISKHFVSGTNLWNMLLGPKLTQLVSFDYKDDHGIVL